MFLSQLSTGKSPHERQPLTAKVNSEALFEVREAALEAL
jgi:hypothetical protein